MTGYLKKRLESLIYNKRTIICRLITEQINKFYPDSFATCDDWGYFKINVNCKDKTPYAVEKRLRQILGVKVYYLDTTPRVRRVNVNDINNPHFAEYGSYNYKLYWRDL